MHRVAPGTTQEVRFSLTRMAAWVPGIESSDEWREWARGERVPVGESLPSLPQMPATLRRHAGPIGRLACDVAYRALDGATDVPLVFCSRYGEAARSVGLLSELARGELLSPTAFSLSVHNAAAGLFSIARRDSANSIAISAGEASAALGVIEACGLLAEGAPRVLIVAVDGVLPDVFRAFEDRQRLPYAWAALIAPVDADPLSLAWEPAAGALVPVSGKQAPAALEALQFLMGDCAEFVQTVENLRFRWSRHG
jgi:hypothetical protein